MIPDLEEPCRCAELLASRLSRPSESHPIRTVCHVSASHFAFVNTASSSSQEPPPFHASQKTPSRSRCETPPTSPLSRDAPPNRRVALALQSGRALGGAPSSRSAGAGLLEFPPMRLAKKWDPRRLDAPRRCPTASASQPSCSQSFVFAGGPRPYSSSSSFDKNGSPSSSGAEESSKTPSTHEQKSTLVSPTPQPHDHASSSNSANEDPPPRPHDTTPANKNPAAFPRTGSSDSRGDSIDDPFRYLGDQSIEVGTRPWASSSSRAAGGPLEAAWEHYRPQSSWSRSWPSSEEVAFTFAQLASGRTRLDFRDFEMATRKVLADLDLSAVEIRRVFDQLDADLDGKISLSEFQSGAQTAPFFKFLVTDMVANRKL